MEIEKILDILDNEVIPINDKDNELTATKINNIYQSQLKSKDKTIQKLKTDYDIAVDVCGDYLLAIEAGKHIKEENTKLKEENKELRELMKIERIKNNSPF
jgi:hypothetical protein